MKTHRSETLKGDEFFSGILPLFVNRSEESFDNMYHSHDFFEIAYVAEGKGCHHIGGMTCPVSSGDMFILPIGVSHVFRPSTPTRRDLVVYNCVFRESIIRELPKALVSEEMLEVLQPRGLQKWYTLTDRRGGFEPLFRSLHDEYHSRKVASIPVMIAMLIQLLARIARHEAGVEDMAAQNRDLLDQVLEYMGTHLGDNLTLSDMASRCRVSSRHFQRLLMRRTGQGFSAYLQSIRMEKAASCCVLPA